MQAGLEETAASQSRDLAGLAEKYAGKSVAEIKPELMRLFHRYGGRVGEPELSEWAQLIADGTQIEVIAEKLNL